MTKLIHLVRHGSHDEVGRMLSGRSEIALNRLGQQQAEALAAAFAGERIASIHSSPRRRAVETAGPLVTQIGGPLHVTAALDEVDFGGFTGRSFAELDGDPDWHRWNAERATARCPGGETMAEAADRAADFLYRLSAVEAPALCITHCDIIRAVTARLIGLPLDRIFALECEPASVTTLAFDAGGGVRLLALNRQALRSA